MKILLENCAASITSCLYAEEAGADRIELCAALPEGGTTPSHGLVKVALQSVRIPIFPIIRPRSGDFLYTEEELRVMEEDIKDFVAMGVGGIVTGILKEDGSLDRVANERMIAAAQGLPVTLHRAFDRVENMAVELERAIEMGFARILTSGGAPKAPAGMEMIRRLVKQAQDRIIIMAGAGIRPDNAIELVEGTGVKELHGTFQGKVKSKMKYRNGRMDDVETVYIEDMDYQTTDPRLIKDLISRFEVQ